MTPKTSLVWTKFSDYLRNFIAQKVSVQSDIDDILQEVFVKIHLNLGTLNNEEKLQSWVFAITRNTINEYFRKNKTYSDIDNFEVPEDENIDQFDKLKDCLRPFIQKLPSKYRRPLYLSDVKGVKQSMIAKDLGITLSGAKSRIQRARELVKQQFTVCCNFVEGEDGKLSGEHGCY